VISKFGNCAVASKPGSEDGIAPGVVWDSGEARESIVESEFNEKEDDHELGALGEIITKKTATAHVVIQNHADLCFRRCLAVGSVISLEYLAFQCGTKS
jgi:hypothetical protein